MTKSVQLQLDGLNCGACVARAEAAIQAVPGVIRAQVNLATKRARVDHASDLGLSEITGALDKAGYPAVLTTARLTIDNMNCGGCAARVEKALDGAQGVASIAPNLADKTVLVRYYTSATTPSDIAGALASAGYPGRIEEAGQIDATKDVQGQEAVQLRRQVLIALALAVPVFVLEMGGHLFPAFHHFVARSIGTQTSWVIQFVLTSLVLAFPGRVFFRLGVPSLLRGAPDMNALVALGATAAWGFSSVVLFAPGLIPAEARAVYFEAAAVIVTLILMGRMLEARAKGQAGAAIRKLVGLQPRTAMVVRDGKAVEMSISDIRVGDEVQLKPGAKVAVDGVVTEGQSWIDESMITGEPVAVSRDIGDTVIAGTVNTTGALSYRARAVGADTMLAHIVAMVEEAQATRLPVQDLVNRITHWFVPAVIGTAVLTLLVWLIFGPGLNFAVVACVSVLIIACPCAMGLAVPTSIMVGSGRAAELGVLFRKGDALQRLRDVDVLAMDKTGTLTLGQPEITDIISAQGQDEDAMLTAAAAIESQSEHPLARAILAQAKAKGLTIGQVKEFRAETGLGARGNVTGKTVLVGSAKYLIGEGVSIETLDSQAMALASKGKTPIFVASDGQLLGVIAVSDPIKPGVPEALDTLRAMGVTPVMLTGDTEATARAVAAQLNISDVKAGLMPRDKLDIIAELKQAGRVVGFVGDGINDAPALAAADIGMAVGTGTDVAIESADVVLVSGDMRAAVNALEISRATMRNIRQNLFWAFGYNVILVPIAAGILYPFFGILLSPMLGAAAMAFSSVFVVSNALRLRRVRAAMKEGV